MQQAHYTKYINYHNIERGTNCKTKDHLMAKILRFYNIKLVLSLELHFHINVALRSSFYILHLQVDNEECVNKVLHKGSSGKTEEKKSRDRESSADKRSKDEVSQFKVLSKFPIIVARKHNNCLKQSF